MTISPQGRDFCFTPHDLFIICITYKPHSFFLTLQSFGTATIITFNIRIEVLLHLINGLWAHITVYTDVYIKITCNDSLGLYVIHRAC